MMLLKPGVIWGRFVQSEAIIAVAGAQRNAAWAETNTHNTTTVNVHLILKFFV